MGTRSCCVPVDLAVTPRSDGPKGRAMPNQMGLMAILWLSCVMVDKRLIDGRSLAVQLLSSG
eukprot:6382976-Lingulodinium_polyedra.AAC.1